MADTTLNQPFDISNFHPEKYSTPNTGMPGLDQLANNAELLGPSAQEYNQSTPTGESISDIINQVRDIQSGMSTLINPYGGPVPNSPSPGGFDVNQSLKDLSKSIQTESLEAYGKPVIIGKEADFKRYKDSPYFQTFGYTPNLGSEQEYKYGNAQTWGDTIGNAIAGGAHLAADTFVEGWKGWGRMAEALFTWDSSKLMGTPEEREEMARKQNDLMSKYAIYDTAESKDSLWNRQFFGNMLQQSGFAVGAIGQFALEEFLTVGAASFLEPALKGVMIGRVAKTAEEAAAIRQAAGLAERTTILGRAAESTKNFFRPNIELATTADDLVNSTRQVANTITKSPNIVNSIASGLKTLTPGYGTVEEMIKLNKAGAGFAQLAYTGLGGIKRGLSEFNMARSESIFESASTYTQLKDRLTEDFIQKNGREPSDDELEKIKQSAENASHDNFAVNMGVLSVMNRIQFDNMFKQFSKSRTLLSEGAAALEGKAFQVTGKIAGKTESRVFKEGLFGRIGALPEIAKTFGKKEAAWQATKAVGKGLMKFEGSEGMQELIQTASDKGLEEYYYQLHHGKKGYTGELDAVVSNLQNPLTDMEGMKTFLMGALTGRLISPISFGFSKTQQKVTEYKNAKKSIENYQKVLENKRAEYVEKYGKEPEGEDALEIEKYAKTTTEYKTLSDQVDESVNLLNALYTNPQWLRNEALANIKVNNQAAATMEEAAANHDRYVFNNVKDSALAKTVAAAIKLDLYSSLRDVIKEYGVEFSDEDFKQAFGIEPTAKNRQNAKQLAENVVAQIEDYHDTFKMLKDKYADRIIPDLYKYNKPKDYIQAMTQKKVLDDIIEMLATNSFKSKRAIIRASQLQTEIAQNKNIGSSAMEVLTKLGSDQALIKHTLTLAEQLDNMSAQETPLTPAQRELYKSIDEELTHIKDWYDSREELLNEREVEKSYKAYAALINIFNKRAGLATAVSREDVEETFLKFKDYIKLNNDNKQYVDAMNLLADPKNMKLVEEAYSSAREFFRSRSMEEQKREIEDATGVPIARHTFKKEVDDTYTVTSPDGVVVEKGIATMEEAKIKANELDAKLREELAKEEAETKAKEEGEVASDIEAKKADWVGNLSNIKDELNKLKNKEEKLQWLADNNYLDPFTQDGKTSNYLKTATGRVVVKIKIGDITIPFYISTGQGEKADVQVDKWYVFFGQGDNGWFNKTSGSDMNKQYGVKIFEDIANILNEVGSKKDEYKVHEDSKGFVDLRWVVATENQLQKVIDFITPVQPNMINGELRATPEQLAQLKQNIQTVKDRVAAELAALEGKPAEEVTAKTIIEDIKKANQAELNKLKETDTSKFTDAEKDEIEKAIATREDELQDIAIKTGTIKTILDTDPEFIVPYMEALEKIDAVVNNPDVTINEVRNIFKILTPVFAKLDKETRNKYTKQYADKRKSIEERINEEIQSKDIEGVKALITKTLDLDSTPIDVSFQTMYNQLNLKLKPEFKEEAIEHFEKEYIKAIDKKLAKLRSELNNSKSSEAITKLLAISLNFRNRIQKSIEEFEKKSKQLNDAKGTLSFTIAVDNAWSNSIHRGILNTNDKESSSAQKIAINNFMISGMISQEDLENVDITRRHDASEIINLGVARMLTLQINKAADDHFNNKGNEKLKEVLTEYLISSGEYGNKLEVEEYMEDFLNKDEYPDKDSLLKALFIPNSKIVDDEQYKLLTLYRITTSTLMQNLSKLDAFDQFTKHQENLIRDQEGTITDEDIITKDLVKYLERYLTKGKTIDELYTNILEAFDKLKTIDTYDEASKLIISSVSSKNLQARGDGLSILQALLGTSLETYNILKSDSVNFTPLSEEEIVRVLNGEMLGSINREQLSQIEEYAKVDKLEEYKKRFQAATGYINNEPIFTYDKITPVTSNPGFNSLRTKSENDVRTAQDLSVSLMPDENGLVQTKFALTFIVNSPYSTQAEKMLAKRLLNLVSDKETIKIDNTIEASGEFDPETDEIFINLEATGYKSDRPSAPVETVILHELVHGLTEKAIADPNSNYRKEIKALYDLIKTKEGAKTFYAYSDTIDPEAQLREFVTEAFTNPAFQYLLATTKYGDENRTVWDKFLDFVNGILEAIGVDINNTALSRVISLTDELLNKNAIIDADKLPSEEMMEKIKNAKSEKDIDEISKNLEENKDKYTSGMYNALNAALKNKLKSINARQVQDILKGMKSIKIDKTTYYYTNDNGVITVYKKGRSKVTKVKDSAIIDDISKQLGVTPPPPPPGPEPVPEGKTVQIFSDLADKKFVEDPSTLTYPAGDSNIVAQDPDSLRSKSFDGITQNGEFIEYRNFTRYYSKVRSIINKLSVAPLEELENFYVVLDKDSAGLRWDGSSEYPGTPGDPRDLSWKDSEKGIVGYIADENGNPIVFDKEGKAIGIADRNDPASSELNNGENQIVYFVTTSENTKEDQLAQMDKESLDKLFAARKAAKEERPQIAKLQKVTVGQMNLGYMTKAQGRSQRNTARDKELTEKMNQDHVSFQLEGNHLNILIEDASGAVNKTALFTPSSRFVKVVGAEGQTYTLFDHAIELMKIYQQMVFDKDPNLTNVKSNLVDFLQNIWLTGSKFNLTIPLTLASMSVKASKEDPWMVKKLFNIKDGIITVNEENLKALKNHIEDMKINISKEWIEGKKDFNFPYITEKDGKKIVTFEKRDYKDFLVNNVGLITYISNIPAKEDIKRYNSNVHFLEPSDLIPKNPTIKVTEKQLVDDKNTTEKAVDDAAKTATPATETKEEIINPAKKKRLSAPSYEQTYEETYQKICK